MEKSKAYTNGDSHSKINLMTTIDLIFDNFYSETRDSITKTNFIEIININSHFSKIQKELLIQNIEKNIFSKISVDEIEIKFLKDMLIKNMTENTFEYSKAFRDLENYKAVKESVADDDVINSAHDIQLIYNEEPVKSKSSVILERLRKIKKRALSNKDNETIEDVDWILQNFVNNDLNEPEFKIRVVEEMQKNENQKQNGLNYLMEYSQQGSFEKKKTDLKLIKIKNLNLSQNNSLIMNGTKTDMGVMSSRRNTRRGSTYSIFVSPSIFAKVSTHLSLIETYDFNIFELNELLEKNTMLSMGTEIFSRKNFFEYLLPEDKFTNFVNEMVNGYSRSVKYHNDLHGSDVFQTLNLILLEGQAQKKLDLTDLDIFAILIAALAHDFKHNGFTNSYHVNLRTDIATTYNDHSVLENYHVSETFKIIKKPNNNIFELLSSEEYRVVRRRIIEGIIHTDMEAHSRNYSFLKNKLDALEIKKGLNINKLIENTDINIIFDNQQQILGYSLHSCDISGNTKEIKISNKWKDLLFEEFFSQGDMERKEGFPISILCDRNTTKINLSQIGFINFVVKPTFELLMNIFPEVYPLMNNLKINLRNFHRLAMEDE